MPHAHKIINDPVYGFISIDHPLIFDLVAHPYYQRLRRIYQMAYASLVYPGAVHTRLHHSLGAYHLMGLAIAELKNKGVEITKEEELSAKVAILLHDIGHGPYSHALEGKLVQGVHHEQISRVVLQQLNDELGGQLSTALEIFSGNYHKHFLHQLVAGQLDVDRMDYLNRDSFFTGVVEGAIGYDRILKMLTVHEGELMIEEKAIYSVEKFLIARRLMYWQVYLHKTVVAAEKMLVMIIDRARQLLLRGENLRSTSEHLDYFLDPNHTDLSEADYIPRFLELDDTDIMATLKKWCRHPDPVLSRLSEGLVNRKLLKVKFKTDPWESQIVDSYKKNVATEQKISEDDAGYFVFTGEAINTIYNPYDEHIKVLFKDGTVTNITDVDNALIHRHISFPVRKYYLCYLR